MQALPQSPRTGAKAAVALLLTFSAGLVDIVGFFTIYHIFVAHMTGNTVHMGSQIATADWSGASQAVSAIFCFVAGSVVGRTIIEAASRHGKRRPASAIFLIEAVLVCVFVSMDRIAVARFPHHHLPIPTLCTLISLLATAMGLQTAALTRIGPLTVHTTFVTGMLNKFAQALSEWLFWLHDQWRTHASLTHIVRRSQRHAAFRNAQFMSAIWLTYLVGSVAGTLMDSRWNTRALYLAVVLLLISVVVDQIWPLSIEEEKEQS